MAPPHQNRSRASDGFASLVAPFSLEVLDQMAESACGLHPDFRLGYVNPAWALFGRANGAKDATELGRDYLTVMPPALRSFHRGLLLAARALREPIDHDYECSTASLSRRFRMRVYACASGAFVIVHSVIREAPGPLGGSAELEAEYRDARGLVVQCSNCRRIRKASSVAEGREAWDWVPEFVAELPPRTSHSICGTCAEYFYGSLEHE